MNIRLRLYRDVAYQYCPCEGVSFHDSRPESEEDEYMVDSGLYVASSNPPLMRGGVHIIDGGELL